MALDSTALAQKMEDELGSLYVAAGKGPLPNLGKADREMLFSPLPRQPFGHSPRLQDAIHLQAEIVV